MTTTTCDDILCGMVQDTLEELGLRPLTECQPGGWPCSTLLNNTREVFRALTPETSEFILELLQNLSPGKLPIRSSRELLKEEPFPCPEIGIDVYQPCQVRSCAFFTHHSWTRNCLLYYRVYKEATQLSTTELEFLLDKPSGSLKKPLLAAMKELRKAALKETISQQSESVFTRIEPPDVCVVCETAIEKPFRRTTKYVYCGDHCYIRKPPFIIDLEKEFNLPADRLLKVCVNNFRSPKAIAQALGITPSKLHHISKRFSIALPD